MGAGGGGVGRFHMRCQPGGTGWPRQNISLILSQLCSHDGGVDEEEEGEKMDGEWFCLQKNVHGDGMWHFCDSICHKRGWGGSFSIREWICGRRGQIWKSENRVKAFFFCHTSWSYGYVLANSPVRVALRQKHWTETLSPRLNVHFLCLFLFSLPFLGVRVGLPRAAWL